MSNFKVGDIVRVTDSWWTDPDNNEGDTTIRDTKAVVTGTYVAVCPLRVDFLVDDPIYKGWLFYESEVELA